MKPQIATTPEQSARLVACGVDEASADMVWTTWNNDGEKLTQISVMDESAYEVSCLNPIPAWSLSALLALFPNIEGRYFSLTKEYPLPGGYSVAYLPWYTDGEIRYAFQDNPIEACVRKIEYLTSKGIKLNYD